EIIRQKEIEPRHFIGQQFISGKKGRFCFYKASLRKFDPSTDIFKTGPDMGKRNLKEQENSITINGTRYLVKNIMNGGMGRVYHLEEVGGVRQIVLKEPKYEEPLERNNKPYKREWANYAFLEWQNPIDAETWFNGWKADQLARGKVPDPMQCAVDLVNETGDLDMKEYLENSFDTVFNGIDHSTPPNPANNTNIVVKVMGSNGLEQLYKNPVLGINPRL